MIIFDTNALRGFSLTGSVAAMLRAIAADAGQSLMISSVTEDEYRSAKRRFYEEKIEAVTTSIKALRRAVPQWRPEDPPYPAVEPLVEREMELVGLMFGVLPPSGAHAIEAVRREADRELPASTDGVRPGAGARDVAIWLTAVERSKTSHESVYLVSADSKAFGKEKLAKALVDEAAMNDAEVILCPSVTNLLDRFATKIEVEIDAAALLESDEILRSVWRDIAASSFIDAAMAIPGGESTFESDGVNDLALRDVSDVQAYEVGGERWIAVRGTWTGTRSMRRTLAGGGVEEDWTVKFEQKLSVLLRLEGDRVIESEVVRLGTSKAEVEKKSVTVRVGVSTRVTTESQGFANAGE